MLIDSLYNSVSQNILSIFGSSTEVDGSESSQEQNGRSNSKGVSNQTSSGDKVSISSEAMALYNRQREIENSEKGASEEQGDSLGQQGAGSGLSETSTSITSRTIICTKYSIYI